MDYRIKFKYEGAAMQKAGAVRQKVIQAQREASKRAGVTGRSDTQLISSIKSLTSGIQKLITSNKDLENTLKRTGGGFGAGGPGPTTPQGGAGFRRFMGFKGAAASIPGIAAVGFAIQKINQIGNAFIEKAGMQARNVGMAGFRVGQGMYTAAEMGGGMRAYARATGRFAQGVTPQQTRGITGLGGFLGMEAPEVLGQAGIYKRAGFDYTRTARQAAGMGIESELPTLLAGIASELEEAVKNGINTSDMSKDLGKEVASLTMRTAGQSVDAALNTIRGFRGVKGAVSKGKIGGLEELYATRATRNIMLKKIGGEGRGAQTEKYVKEGLMTESERQQFLVNKPETFEDIQKVMGPKGALMLQKAIAERTSTAMLQKGTMQEMQKQFGTDIGGKRTLMAIAGQMNFSGSQAQRLTLWDEAMGKAPAGDIEDKGAAILKKGMAAVETSKAAMAKKREISRENIVFKYGDSFAETSLKMEKALINIADKTAPFVTGSIETLGNVALAASEGLNAVAKSAKSFYNSVILGGSDRKKGYSSEDYVQ
jgi:hypothetical protein